MKRTDAQPWKKVLPQILTKVKSGTHFLYKYGFKQNTAQHTMMNSSKHSGIVPACYLPLLADPPPLPSSTSSIF